MEEYIADTKRICTNYFGEQGLGEKIGNNVRDGLLCEAVERIQDDSSTPASVCLELREHLMYDPVCCAALKKLDTFTQGISKFPLFSQGVELEETEEQKQHRAVCCEIMEASNDGELILDAIENHTNISSIQLHGAQILGELISNRVGFPRHSSSGARASQALLSPLTHFPDCDHVLEIIFRIFHKFKDTAISSWMCVYFVVENASSIPACFTALRRYPANYHVVNGAFFLLTNLFAHHRRSFKAFVRENPEARDIAQNAVETQN